VRFDDRVTGKIDAFAPKAHIVHIDIDPTSIRKNIRVSVPIVGDCRITLHKLNRMLDAESLGNLKERRQPWLRQVEEWKRTKPLAYTLDDRVIKPQYVIEKLFEITQESDHHH
jgi:acetolactate synthase-1/2/3 large subunit